MTQETIAAPVPGYDVIVMFQQDDEAKLTMSAHFQGERYQPANIKTHAALDILSQNWPDMVKQIEGGATDADRYRALLAYSMLGQSEETRQRFEAISAILQAHEEDKGQTDGPRTADEFRESSDVLIQALIETTPADQVEQGAPA